MDLQRLNSIRKYPSIPTYHVMGDKGRLQEHVQVSLTGPVVVTEKVDGTNGSVVMLPDGDWFIGSREELLTAARDRVHNPALGIVEALRPLATNRIDSIDDTLVVAYFEVYGGKTTARAKEYTTTGTMGARLFDVALIPWDAAEDMLDGWAPDRIAAWRDGGGQTWATEDRLAELAAEWGLQMVPRLRAREPVPVLVDDVGAWLAEFSATHVHLDGGTGQAEGVVLRTPDRSRIAKVRFEDYERTLKRRLRAPKA